MTREQFLVLAGQLWDAQQRGASQPSGTGDGRSPKWDTALPAGTGMVTYASECSLKELLYQKKRADEPPSKVEYAEANLKRSKSLGYWVAYRQANPSERWQGERNKALVVALAPLDKPAKYPRNAPAAAAPAVPTPSFDEDNDIPF